MFQDSLRYVESDRIDYNRNTELLKTAGRSKLIEGAQTLTAVLIDFDQKTKAILASVPDKELYLGNNLPSHTFLVDGLYGLKSSASTGTRKTTSSSCPVFICWAARMNYSL